jgi:hypothetical protein
MDRNDDTKGTLMATSQQPNQGYVDRWLKRSLSERYTLPQQDPLPDDLADLLRPMPKS